MPLIGPGTTGSVPGESSSGHLPFQYKPLCKPGQLICGTGQTAVITGWTVKQTVAKQLDKSEFAVIGQLYSSTRGISLLIRNLLANPHVRFVVVLNATQEDRNAGGCECLLDFFKQGFVEGESDTGRHCWVIRSRIAGYIDWEIPATVLEQLRQSVIWQEVGSIAEAVAIVRKCARGDFPWPPSWKSYAQRGSVPGEDSPGPLPGMIVEPWRQPLTLFASPTVAPTLLPGTRYGHRIEGRTIAETWVKIIHRIKTTGTIRSTLYDGQWQELIDLMAIVTAEPADFYFPDPNYLPVDRPFVEQYIAQILEDVQYQEGVKYTYGQRLRSWFGQDQIEQVIQSLVTKLDSARAVMSLWDVQDHNNTESPPCLNHIWVRVIGGELSLTATFRSNDMFSAWPANAIGLRALQQHICDQIGSRSTFDLKMGPLITMSQSAHIYDDCWDSAEKLVQAQYLKICKQRDYADPSGSFTISVQDNAIVVEHMTPGSGEVVNCYSGSSANQLIRQIAVDCPALQVEHALYLGTELQKAEFVVTTKPNFVYEQDKPLRAIEKSL